MQNPVARDYRGYAVRPSAHRLPDGYFSSNLSLTRPRSAISSPKGKPWAFQIIGDATGSIPATRSVPATGFPRGRRPRTIVY
ncbi:hypothetical protein FAZ97_34105 [Paraburkholderia acidiphila]|uniref:Uncharacterized protein n=1 Tax=Paraburkholderia acidiphila TaxID=2571747 RepID=A0A7Z2JE02_9BURK|nr:hypothetical protein FAZ97_34105 [Paraburkholderia acidiphila]